MKGIDELENNFYAEFNNNLFQINDDNGRKAYIKGMIRSINKTEFIERNKTEILEIFHAKKFDEQHVYLKLLLKIVFVLFRISEFIEVTCMDFGFIKDVDEIRQFDITNSFKENLFFWKSTKGKHEPAPIFDSIDSIFINPGNLQKVIDCLIDYETLNEKGELIKKNYHISAISEALKIKGVINKKVSKTQRNKLFAGKFNIIVSDRTARAENIEHETLLTEYKDLFDTVKFL
ncbi:MAG: hypothetical protein M0R16_08940 [Bacteroidales bacterium]|nr:hypothetical protein [Bacteroidales bacterium]